MDTMPPFDHLSEPRALRSQAKYRDDEVLPNIMFDPRVMRGSTFSQRNRDKMLITMPPATPVAHGGGIEAARRLKDGGEASRKKLKWREKSIYDYRAPKSGPGGGLDLTSHLVEKKTKIAVAEIDTQTDEFEPAPAPAPYVPKKSGVDSWTQMTADDQPFDFDREVVPLLEVVTLKTLEQALLEVEQEAELARIAHDFDQLQTAARLEAERIAALEADTAANHKRMRDRKRAERERVRRESEVRQKVCAVQLMRQCWADTAEGAMRSLEAKGQWHDPTTHQIRADVLPWLYAEVDSGLKARRAAMELADTLLADALAFAAQAAWEGKTTEEGKTWVRVFLEASSLGLEEDTVVGPILVDPKDSTADLERKVAAWLRKEGLKVDLPPGGFLQLALGGKALDLEGGGQSLGDARIADNTKLEVVLPPLSPPRSGGSSKGDGIDLSKAANFDDGA